MGQCWQQTGEETTHKQAAASKQAKRNWYVPHTLTRSVMYTSIQP